MKRFATKTGHAYPLVLADVAGQIRDGNRSIVGNIYKGVVDNVLMRITAHNRGPEAATLVFHPNAAGQNRIADVTYPGRFTW